MRLAVLCVMVTCVAFAFGCTKKESLTDSQVPLSIEMVPVTNATSMANQAIGIAETAGQIGLEEVALPQGPFKPTPQEIQTALKNAGYYAGEVDGKLGPQSKKAIEEFQKANGLQVDGKVGPKTWEALSKNLSSVTAITMDTAGTVQ